MKAETIKTKVSFILLLTLLAASISSCGMQGDLYLPGDKDPNTSSTLEMARQ